MRSFGSMHNDYLDPDRWLWEPEPHCIQSGCEGLCSPSDEEEYLWVCEECGSQYELDEDGQFVFARPSEWDSELIRAMTMELYRIERHRPTFTCTVDQFFDHAPKGDFEWRDDGMCGDWNVYCCGESDCTQQWHKIQYQVHMGRKNGFRWVEVDDCDESGNHDCVAEWRESDDLKLWKNGEAKGFDNDFGEFFDQYVARSWDHFLGWAQYWLDVYRTGKDPCDDIIGDGDVRAIALKSVASNLKYLYDIIARGY